MKPKKQRETTLLEMGPSPFRFRIFALCYDTLILVALWAVTTALIVLISGRVVTGALLQSILLVETFIFFCFFWIHRGQTIGMLAWKLRLKSSSTFTLRSALFRFCGELLSILTLGFGYYWIWFDKNRRSWSDLFSNSCVIRYKYENTSVDLPQQVKTTSENDKKRK